MEKNIAIDTSQALNYQNRIEYQLLQTDKKLQKANLDYYIWSFLPSLTAIGEYNLNFQNDQLSKLYNQDYPNSYIGLQLSFPIFQGGKRIQQIDQAELQLKLYDYDLSALKSSVNTEYTQALSNYKSNLNNYQTQKDNLELANNVYKIIELQYKSGIKTYLNVITAETNLRSTQVNYLNALYQVLISKIDLEKALGTIHY
jgi:outer membrane protein TolC